MNASDSVASIRGVPLDTGAPRIPQDPSSSARAADSGPADEPPPAFASARFVASRASRKSPASATQSMAVFRAHNELWSVGHSASVRSLVRSHATFDRPPSAVQGSEQNPSRLFSTLQSSASLYKVHALPAKHPAR